MKAARMKSVLAGISLSGTITDLHIRFGNIKQELMHAKSEVRRLRKELARRPQTSLLLSLDELGALRRQVAFRCHPDRGGSGTLMQRLNVFFDSVESQARNAGR